MSTSQHRIYIIIDICHFTFNVISLNLGIIITISNKRNSSNGIGILSHYYYLAIFFVINITIISTTTIIIIFVTFINITLIVMYLQNMTIQEANLHYDNKDEKPQININ